MGAGYLETRFTIRKPFLFEISQKRKKREQLKCVCVETFQRKEAWMVTFS